MITLKHFHKNTIELLYVYSSSDKVEVYKGLGLTLLTKQGRTQELMEGVFLLRYPPLSPSLPSHSLHIPLPLPTLPLEVRPVFNQL